MNLRLTILGAAAAVSFAALPAPLTAQGCSYTFSLGIGGSISGCYSGVITELGEDAGGVSGEYYWAGNFGGVSGATNSPTTPGTFMFNNDCGSPGTGTFAFCTGAFAKPLVPITSTSGELVIGLQVPDNSYGNGFYWVYSGAASRNAVPAPPGYQEVLLQLTHGGVDDPGQFLFGWEDMNTGCTARTAVNNNRFREEDLGNGPLLNTVLEDCTAITPGGNSDSDFNDSYKRFDISGVGSPLSVTPEPMTMSLMAMGLIGIGASSLKRKRK